MKSAKVAKIMKNNEEENEMKENMKICIRNEAENMIMKKK